VTPSGSFWTGTLRRGATPVILQTEAAECGLACLAMVAGAHGLDTDLPTLRQRFSLSLKGVTLADMVRMAEAMQLNSRALRAELDELPQVQQIAMHLRLPVGNVNSHQHHEQMAQSFFELMQKRSRVKIGTHRQIMVTYPK
jgi:ABC-type bacteriocin/lantibiotic exporter with double-glycine peptidase domain